MKDLHVVLTGAAAGIGAETARLLRRQGARLTLLDRQEPTDAPAPGERFLMLDQGDRGSIDAAVAAIDAPVDALINVAGVPPRPGQAVSVLNINFRGLRRLTLGLLPKLTPGASIVNVSSRAGMRWREHLPQVKALLDLPDDADLAAFVAAQGIDDVRSYDLSKEAVTVWGLQQCEPLIARGLRMNSVSPGAVDTAILGDFLAAFGDRARPMIARVGRPAQAAEVAQVIAFLASPRSAWLKGLDLPVDGGTGALLACDALGLR